MLDDLANPMIRRPVNRWLALAALSLPFATGVAASTVSPPTPEGTFHLEAESTQRITLIANYAALSEILSRLGEELDIEIVAKLPDDPRVTIEFTAQPLQEALKKIAGSYMLLTDEVDGQEAKVFVLPEGTEAGALQSPVPADSHIEPAESGDTPFKFEFDPAAAPEKTDHEGF